MVMAGTKRREWRKAKGCEASACVEVAIVRDRVAVRDGKDPAGPRLVFGAEQWRTFLDWTRDCAW